MGEHLVCSPCGAVASSFSGVVSVLRKADAGGVAVALEVAKIGLYPIACFLGGKNWISAFIFAGCWPALCSVAWPAGPWRRAMPILSFPAGA